jgi:hypothetical protein
MAKLGRQEAVMLECVEILREYDGVIEGALDGLEDRATRAILRRQQRRVRASRFVLAQMVAKRLAAVSDPDKTPKL